MIKEIIATIATVLVSSSYIPQIIKGYKTKSLKDLSMSFLAIVGTGVFLWILYGIFNSDPTFIIANAVILLFVITIVAMKMHYD
jgi:MtN3 and saliva related transmembrane protein